MRDLLRFFTILLCVLWAAQPGWAGHAEGNGGDHVRAMFLKMGSAVLSYLRETQEGAAIASRNNLDLARLEATLDAEKLLVVEAQLADSGGSAADAIGVPGKITLRKDRWMDHFERDRDVYYLVFHEMLRAAEYDDNSYVISGAVVPFPAQRRVLTRIVPVVPLIDEDLIAPFVMLEEISLGGTGCPSGKVGTSFDFDTERNVLDATFEKYLARSGLVNGAPRPVDRKACAFAIPVALPAGKRIVVTQLDVLGEVDLAPGATAALRSEAFLGGGQGPQKSKEARAQGAQRLKGKLLERRTDLLKSRCGGSDLIRLNTSATLNGLGAETPDLFEVKRASIYFRLESCADPETGLRPARAPAPVRGPARAAAPKKGRK